MKIEQRDEKKAIEYLEKAAHDSRVSTRNDECKSEAQLLVGICYYRGFIVEQDFIKVKSHDRLVREGFEALND